MPVRAEAQCGGVQPTVCGGLKVAVGVRDPSKSAKINNLR
jgi:hypothetical protein